MHYVYLIKNCINEKVYVGVTDNPKQRFRDHKCNALTRNKKSKLYEAIRNIGWENFYLEIIEEIHGCNYEEIETEYIKKYDSVENGYNTKYRTSEITKVREFNIETIIEMYQQGITQKVIADTFLTDKKHISRILKDNNIPIRNWNKEQSNSKISRKFLLEELKTKKVSQIAKELNLSTTAIRNWIKKFNIKMPLSMAT